MGGYGVDPTNPKCIGGKGDRPGCSAYVEFYRCQTLEEFAKSNRNLFEGLDEIRKGLEAVECGLSGFATGASPVRTTESAYALASDTLAILQRQAEAGIRKIAKHHATKPIQSASALDRETLMWNEALIRTGALQRQVKISLKELKRAQ